ncbi:MAG: energy transducer TonB [Bacteroidales bacterium]|jgi:TonB family protein
MQLLYENNRTRSLTSQKGKGVAGTLLIHLAVFGLLMLVGFSIPVNSPTDPGIMVNFGTDETGSGLIEPSPPANPENVLPSAPVKTAGHSQDEPVITQNNEEAPVIKNGNLNNEKKHHQETEADNKKREELQSEKIKEEQEELEKKQIEADQKRQADIMNRTKNALVNSKNSGTSSTSEGVAGGTGNQGVPNGSVDSQIHGPGGGTGNSGVSYDLQGRGFQKLPLPKYEYQGEGKVVVEVSVDRSGKVIEAIPGIKGSSTLDEYLLKAAKEAALNAQFEIKPNAPFVQKGTITYNFVLK